VSFFSLPPPPPHKRRPLPLSLWSREPVEDMVVLLVVFIWRRAFSHPQEVTLAPPAYSRPHLFSFPHTLAPQISFSKIRASLSVRRFPKSNPCYSASPSPPELRLLDSFQKPPLPCFLSVFRRKLRRFLLHVKSLQYRAPYSVSILTNPCPLSSVSSVLFLCQVFAWSAAHLFSAYWTPENSLSVVTLPYPP